MREEISIRNGDVHDQTFTIVTEIERDATSMESIKSGAQGHGLEASGLTWSWREGAAAILDPGDAEVGEANGAITLSWTMTIPARGAAAMVWSLEASAHDLPFIGPGDHEICTPATQDERMQRLLNKAFKDLNGLQMAAADNPDHRFLAAGSPWFFTLFGRDSLIAARLLGETAPDLAKAALRTLAARQGTSIEIETAEQPGKILHEVRRVALTLHEMVEEHEHTVTIPPEYYGTIDATCLWIMLLGDLEAAGQDVTEFLPALDQALVWLRDHSDTDGDGFLEYKDLAGTGLANQGWKDSGDSIRFSDGSMAEAPIALCEVQGYAYASAAVASRLLARQGRADEASEWDEWAAALKQRFRDQFWVEDEFGRFPALALDAHKRPVDGWASNMGHLLGTGILDADEAAIVVDRLTRPEMFSGYGVRTLSTTNVGYWPLGYHVGSVWTHDTAICIEGMLREGYNEQARTLASGLLRASEGFDHRLPELFSGLAAPGHGETADVSWPPAPYPASCRPQAWAAASAVIIMKALDA